MSERSQLNVLIQDLKSIEHIPQEEQIERVKQIEGFFDACRNYNVSPSHSTSLHDIIVQLEIEESYLEKDEE